KLCRLALPNGSCVTNTYDSMDRLIGTYLKDSNGTTLNYHSYIYDVAGQRSRQTRTSGDYVDYTYDNLGQLKLAKGYESGGATRLHEQFGYAYDAAWNLSFRTNGALVQTFIMNNLNQLATCTRSNTLTVAGTTTSSATNVTVNSATASRYADNTFAKDGFSLLNGSNTFTAIAQDSYGRTDTDTVSF